MSALSTVHPVFYDARGWRWKFVRLAVIVSLTAGTIMLGTMGWAIIQPPAIDTSTAASFTGADKSKMPVFGEGTLQRVVLLQRQSDRVIASEPFTGEIVSLLTTDEQKEVGTTSDYAIQRYGQLPNKQLALTFDDGPDPAWTPQVLDVLARNHIQATFFLIGSNVAKWPELAQRIVREGHVVGNHTFTHPDISKQSEFDLGNELVIADRVLRATTGKATRLFRPPYGGNDVNSIRRDANALYLTQKLGYTTTMYDLDSHDWEFTTRDRRPVPLNLDGKGHVVHADTRFKI